MLQVTDLLSTCQKKGIQHHDLRPQSIFVRNDYKTLALGYFGEAKFMGKRFFSKEALRYLSPKLMASTSGTFEMTG